MRRVVAAAAQFRFGFWLAGSAASGGTTGLTALSIDWAPAAGWCARSTVVRMQTCASDHKRLGRCASRILTGSARLGSARLGSARLGSARLGSARLGSARLGSARLGSARLGSARLGSARHDYGEKRNSVCQPHELFLVDRRNDRARSIAQPSVISVHHRHALHLDAPCVLANGTTNRQRTSSFGHRVMPSPGQPRFRILAHRGRVGSVVCSPLSLPERTNTGERYERISCSRPEARTAAVEDWTPQAPSSHR